MTDPRPGPPRASADAFDFNRPTIVALLYLASFVVGITGLIGVILAYVWRGEPHEPWAASHYTYLIRTFWIGLIGCVIGIVLMVILIGWLLLIAVGLWALARSVVSLINAQKRAPMPDPRTLLF